MKKHVFLIFALTICFLVVPAVQATETADYAALKTAYINSHPGQSILPFPWDPGTSVKVLPFDYEIPASPGNTFSLTACRNESEPASFIINSQKIFQELEFPYNPSRMEGEHHSDLCNRCSTC